MRSTPLLSILAALWVVGSSTALESSSSSTAPRDTVVACYDAASPTGAELRDFEPDSQDFLAARYAAAAECRYEAISASTAMRISQTSKDRRKRGG